MTRSFQGDIEAESTAVLLMCQADDGSAGYVATERVVGRIGKPLSVAAISGIEDTEQSLAAGLQGKLLQAGEGLWLAITAAVVTASTSSVLGSAQITIPSVVAQLSGFRVGLLVEAVGAVA